jgi:23S rRNA (guanosine2251-2'-O)-methyltransferase
VDASGSREGGAKGERAGSGRPDGWVPRPSRHRAGGGGSSGGPPRPRSSAERGKSGASKAAKRDRRRADADALRASIRPGAGRELIHGRRPVVEALRAGRPIDRIFVAAGAGERGALAEVLNLAKTRRVSVQTVPRALLEAEAGTGAHQGVVALVEPLALVELDELLATPLSTGEPPFFLAVDAITDPHNLGALVRSADAAGCHGVVVPRHRNAPLSATTVKASAGALEHVPVAEVTNLARAVEKLRASGVWCIGLAEDAPASLFDLQLADEPVCVVVGGEGAGLHRVVREACDLIVSIPMSGHVASLNASVAGALAMFEVRRRRGGTGPRPPAPAAGPDEREAIQLDLAEAEQARAGTDPPD